MRKNSKKILAAGVAILLAQAVQAAPVNLNWDASGADPHTTGGTGNWDKTSSLWYNGTGYTTWTDGNNAVFERISSSDLYTASSVITLATDISANALTLSGTTARFSTINLNGHNLQITGTTAVVGGSGNIIKNDGATSTITFNCGPGSLIYNGNLNLTLNASWNTTTVGNFNGLVTIQAGTVNLNAANHLGASSASVSLTNTGALTVKYDGAMSHNIALSGTSTAIASLGSGHSITLDGQISGSGDLRLSGAGTFVVSGNNSHTGNTTLLNSGSTLILASNNALGTSLDTSRTVTSNSGFTSTIGFQGGINIAAIPSISLGGIGTGGAASLHAFTGDNTFGGAIALTNSGVTVGADASSSLKLTGKITSGVNTYGISKIGLGRVELTSSANDYSGGVTISAGTLSVNSIAANGTAQPLGTATSAISLGSATSSTAGTLEYTGSSAADLQRNVTVNYTGGTIKNSGGATLTLSGTLTKDGKVLTLAGGNINVSGSVVGSSAGSDFNIDGATVTVTGGNNTYNGNTNISNGGKVVVAHSSGSSPLGTGTVHVNSTASLSGSGNASASSLEIHSGGTVAPGSNSAVGTLNTAGQTWDGGGTYVVKLNVNDVASNDKLTMSGLTLAADSGNRFKLAITSLSGGGSNAFDGAHDYSWIIAHATSALSSVTADLFTLDTSHFDGTNYVHSDTNQSSSGSFAIGAAGGDLTLSYNATVAAPEPTSLFLLGAPVAALFMNRRTRRRACEQEPAL